MNICLMAVSEEEIKQQIKRFVKKLGRYLTRNYPAPPKIPEGNLCL